MTTDDIRKQVSAVGIGPLALVAAGLAWKKFRAPLLAAGVVWGLANVLYAKREVTATVTAEEPTITYHASDKPYPSDVRTGGEVPLTPDGGDLPYDLTN